MKRYMQYGCVFSEPNRWINYNASPALQFEWLPLVGKAFTRNRFWIVALF